MKPVEKNILLAVLAGIVIGALLLISIRMVTYRDESVHYHANFALYVNGEHQTFDNFTFYEEVQACTDENLDNPRSRVHMHNNESHVVHIHDKAVTWGHFFANLGYGLTSETLQMDERVYVDGQDVQQLRFVLNGVVVDNAANRLIGNEDVLLVDYSNDNEETIKRRFAEMPTDAGEYNHRQDPGGCSGNQAQGFWARLREAAGI